jgi:hypothetical protein
MDTNAEGREIFGELPEPTLNELIFVLDNNRKTFIETSKTYKNFPLGKTFKPFLDSVNTMGYTIQRTADHILYSDPTESATARANMVMAILSEDEIKRVEHFNNLLAVRTFSPAWDKTTTMAQDLAEIIEQESDGQEDDDNVIKYALGHVMGVYTQNATFDITKFVETVAESKNAQLIHAATLAGKKALELSLVGGVAALGAWLAVRNKN